MFPLSLESPFQFARACAGEKSPPPILNSTVGGTRPFGPVEFGGNSGDNGPMQRKLVRIGTAALAVSTLVFVSAARAQPFYQAGQVSIALERGFGIHHVSSTREPDVGAEQDFDATVIGVGWAGAVTPLHYTRAAIDGFITDQLSLGGSLGFFSQSGDWEGNGFIFSPRVGYAIPLSRVFTFWPRGGFTYYDIGDTHLIALSGEAMFVASPHPSWGILFGPTLDFGFTGEQGGDNADYTAFSIGFPAVGLMGTF